MPSVQFSAYRQSASTWRGSIIIIKARPGSPELSPRWPQPRQLQRHRHIADRPGPANRAPPSSPSSGPGVKTVPEPATILLTVGMTGYAVGGVAAATERSQRAKIHESIPARTACVRRATISDHWNDAVCHAFEPVIVGPADGVSASEANCWSCPRVALTGSASLTKSPPSWFPRVLIGGLW